MVNNIEFSKRLKTVMDYYGLTATALADSIQIQRSSISHLLSGRNKPSLDFVLKVLEEYPEVELYWLLNGKGSFPKVVKTDTSTLFSEGNSDFPSHFDLSKNQTEADIEKIIVFYKNGTFKSYTP
ncbi:MAG: helix-turn-helix transcriptional regulator [Flavobacteriaceae bacterium]